MPAAYTSEPSVQVLDFEDNRLLIRRDRLTCDFCSSSQGFACGFLQIPPRDGHPCRPASASPCRVRRGLSPPSGCALPGAQQKSEAISIASLSLLTKIKPFQLRTARHPSRWLQKGTRGPGRLRSSSLRPEVRPGSCAAAEPGRSRLRTGGNPDPALDRP